MTGTTANYGFSYPQGTDLVTNGAAAIQTLAEGVDTALLNTPSSYRNLLINGGMDIYQRGNNPTFSFATSGTRTYSIDRWSNTWNSSMGSWAVTRSTTVPTGQGFGYSFKMDCTATTTSSSGRMMIVQAIEGQNVQHVRKGTTAAKQLTLSFWAYTTRTGGGTMIAELEDYTNSRFVSAAVTINAASTWEYKTVTFPADTTGTLANSNAAALGLNLWINAGSTYSGGASLQTTWGTTTNRRAFGCTNFADNTANDVHITGVQLEVGSVDTPFEFEPIAATLANCQRYYYKDPACTGTGLGATTIARFTGQHLVEMRAAPAITISNTVQAFGGSGTWTATGATGTNYSDTRVLQVDLPCTGGPATAGLAAIRVWQTTPSGPIGTIQLDAEL